MNSKINLSVILPVYNEENSIGSVITELKKHLARLKLNYEILAINDGSTDQTKKIIEQIADLRVINHTETQGYGASLKDGIKQSHGDLILIIDADGTYPVESIFNLIEHAFDYDMVIGARTNKEARIPLIRKPAKFVINKLANYLSGTKIDDLNSGLRVMKRPFVEKFFPILPNGFSFTTTITLAALVNDHKVKYIPINYYKRIGKSKIRPIRDTLNFFYLIIRTVLYFNPLKIFLPLSVILFLTGIGIFIYSYFFTPYILDTTIALFVISAIQIFAIGVLADLITKLRQ